MTSDVTIRPLRPNDLEAAGRIYRLAFGTFVGHPDPIRFAGDAATVPTRQPNLSLAWNSDIRMKQETSFP